VNKTARVLQMPSPSTFTPVLNSPRKLRRILNALRGPRLSRGVAPLRMTSPRRFARSAGEVRLELTSIRRLSRSQPLGDVALGHTCRQ